MLSHPFRKRPRNGWGTRCFWLGRFSGPRIGTGGTRDCFDAIGGACFQEVGQVFPEELAAVNNLARAHVEEIHCQAAVFKVIAKDVGVVALLGGGDALLFLELMNCGELVAETRG